jgi:inulin fructotransferase (DFA-I-forming)
MRYSRVRALHTWEAISRAQLNDTLVPPSGMLAALLGRRAFIGGGLSAMFLGACGGGGGGVEPPSDDGGNPAMNNSHYDVTDYGATAGDPSKDLAAAFASIFADINGKDPKAGANIYIPAGDFYLNTTVDIAHDFITISGANYGFETGTGNGGGSRVVVRANVGFAAAAGGSGRLNSLTFRNLLLDGEAASKGRTGIDVQRDNDGLVIEGIAAKEFGNAVVIRNADAAYICGNLLLESNSCLRLVNNGKACIVANNRLGGKPAGITLFAENHERLVVSGNSIFPDGYSNFVLKDSVHCVVAANQFQSYYTGMLHLEGSGCRNNTIVANTMISESSPGGAWNVNPFRQFDDGFGVIRAEGSHNLISGNQVDSKGGTTHAMIRLVGDGNHVSDCILSAVNGSSRKLVVDSGTEAQPNTVMDCVTSDEAFFAAGSVRRFRALPMTTAS